MRKRDLKVVVTGYIGLLPAGGVTWDYIQYPLGLRELGCDVLYVEDTQQWPVFQQHSGEIACTRNVAYLAETMERFGMGDRWMYRDEITGTSFGRTADEVRRFCASADMLVNLSCSAPLREEYAGIPVRALVDTDPMFTQVQCITGETLYGGRSSIPEMIAGHTHLFTFGENLGRATCEVPTCDLLWRPTRQPVVMKYWPFDPLPKDAPYTSVFNWSAAKDFTYDGRSWGQKSREFMHYLHLPQRTQNVTYRIGIGHTVGSGFPMDLARGKGWEVIEAERIASDVDAYRSFIRDSKAEFSVAKHAYVQANTGWFSCRSACYLASGRPVVTQDTGWSEHLPIGSGLFAFRDIEGALHAVEQIEREPERHAAAARALAEEFFASDNVLGAMLAELGA